MIISVNHIVQEELYNSIHILLARAYPLQIIIKNIKNPLSTPAVTCYLNGYHMQKQTFSPLASLSRTEANHSQPPSMRTGTQLTTIPHFPLSDQLLIQNPAAFTTMLSTPHNQMAHHNKIPNTFTHIHLYTSTGKHTHSSYTILLSPL